MEFTIWAFPLQESPDREPNEMDRLWPLAKCQDCLVAHKNIFLIGSTRLSRFYRRVCGDFQAAGINGNWCQHAALWPLDGRS